MKVPLSSFSIHWPSAGDQAGPLRAVQVLFAKWEETLFTRSVWSCAQVSLVILSCFDTEVQATSEAADGTLCPRLQKYQQSFSLQRKSLKWLFEQDVHFTFAYAKFTHDKPWVNAKNWTQLASLPLVHVQDTHSQPKHLQLLLVSVMSHTHLHLILHSVHFK